MLRYSRDCRCLNWPDDEISIFLGYAPDIDRPGKLLSIVCLFGDQGLPVEHPVKLQCEVDAQDSPVSSTREPFRFDHADGSGEYSTV
jgi:hypothetical protein